MKKTTRLLIAGTTLAVLGFGSLGVLFAWASVEPTLVASQTVANVPAGTDDQTDSVSATIANVAEVKATRTLGITAIPVGSTTIAIGTCTITFATTTAGAGTAEDTDCTGGAVLRTTTGTASDTPRTIAQLATAFQLLTNVSDTGHGALTVAAGTVATTTVFTTTGTESTTTPITFTDGTTGKITSISSTSGVVPVAQKSTITIGGTVEAGDVYTAHLPGSVDASYTVLSSGSTTANIATGLNSAIQASTGYAGQAFTSVASSSTVVLTAKTAGTGFVLTTGTTNLPAVAQTVTFTPANVSGGYTYVITINGSNYSSVSSSLSSILTDLVTGLTGVSGVSCSQDGTKVTCVASPAGTTFTYDSSATLIPSIRSTSGGGSHGGGGGSSSSVSSSNSSSVSASSLTDMIASLKAKLAVLMSQAGMGSTISSGVSAVFAHDLTVGSVGADVKALQVYLNAHGFVVASTGAGSPGSETMTFGGATKAALMKFQAAKGITPAAGYFGAKSRAYVTTNP